MASEIDNFRLKIRNTRRLNRSTLTYSLTEASALEKEIEDLEEHIEKLETELLQNKTMSIDIVGRDF